ncbi:hypothetical protein ABT297_27720 [Dactylosporangium sp. NPDC000555]|uniref:hypothetical protein n=1 Tax=Dactylosporangium sp. NPDC000555 TaxID=3154260 RepID=UPI003323980A
MSGLHAGTPLRVDRAYVRQTDDEYMLILAATGVHQIRRTGSADHGAVASVSR